MALIFLLFVPWNVQGQDPYVRHAPYYPDQRLTHPLQDSLQRNGLSTRFITLLTQHQHHDITYFIWFENHRMQVVQITDSTLSAPLICRSQRFSAVLDLPQLAIRESENRLRFVPPANARGTDIAWLEIDGQPYLIEHGPSAGYILAKTKNTSRTAFFRLLKQDLATLQRQWQVARAYTRFPKQ
ncbi:hypothetical protein [Hymenobacter guriensis]|uniref:Uncharacterized protein n=1 Tax=Hymenobacter guriensis TaxID=2793065 RepID=A0ABS0KZJ3_9BACT|nr:hypothetical protein [Hymenobacter guriensis]MBG8552557.1 hypothetical protein [Hymenobacter guriensis]